MPYEMLGCRNAILRKCQTSPMSGLTVHRGKTAVYMEDHIDTDRIIPGRFLSRVTREGYGHLLFCDVRGVGFPLDDSAAIGATVLVVGTNFGCGSSREHAVWAIQQAGFVAVIGKETPTTRGFSDIFRQNAANCGLLLIDLKAEDHQGIVEAGSGAEACIDLPAQSVSVGGRSFRFDIDAATKEALVSGLDLIGTTLVHADAISTFEKEHDPFVPQTLT